MKKFIVTCTMIHNGSMEVIAENQEDALNIAQEKLNNDADCVCWQFDEVTADCAADCEDEYQPKYKVGDVLVSNNNNIDINFTIVGITDDGKYECSDGEYDKIDELDYNEEYHLAEDWELKIINNVTKYKVGDYLISIDSIKRYGLNSDKLILFQITDIRDGKYITSDDKEDVIECLDINGDFRLATPDEVNEYYQSHHKYEVGDYVGDCHYGYYQITAIKDGKYVFDDGDEVPIEIFDADENHHIETFHREDFKPFDKVIVRDDESCTWIADFFSHILTNNNGYQYATCGGICWEQCVPYNSETAHLLGTTTEYNGKYKTW